MRYTGGRKDTNKTYFAIDLKSFYASVECVERGLDPLTTNLVVADLERTEKTICLAVSPSLKELGISGRARLYEVVEKTRQINLQRKKVVKDNRFAGSSSNKVELNSNPKLKLDYIVATPRMSLYIHYSRKIYQLYLRFFSPMDIHVYSIDEVFIDATSYLHVYHETEQELCRKVIEEIYRETGITATGGIAENLYLSKIAMDIVAKRVPANTKGVRIAQLNEIEYRKKLWTHRPLTDFWRIGEGTARKLEANGLYTMGDIARCSLENEDLLYNLLGVNAELLIDHAWGVEKTTLQEIKNYKPKENSLSSGQVLKEPYDCTKAKVVVCEMADALAMELLSKHLVTKQIDLRLEYDVSNIRNNESGYQGKIERDAYGRTVPKSSYGSLNLEKYTSSAKDITGASEKLFNEIAREELLIRRIYLTAKHVMAEDICKSSAVEQMDIFSFTQKNEKEKCADTAEQKKERRKLEAILKIRSKYGKNAILKGTDFRDGATTVERNDEIGGHKA
jgi:DNA polymerase V